MQDLPTGPLSASGAHNLKVHDHVANNLFATHLIPGFTWHNFAVQVDWDNLILGVFYSPNNPKLTAVAGVLQNPTISLGATGQGDFPKPPSVLSCIQYEKLLLVYLNGARPVERHSALRNTRRDKKGLLLLRCPYRECGQGRARIPCAE